MKHVGEGPAFSSYLDGADPASCGLGSSRSILELAGRLISRPLCRSTAVGKLDNNAAILEIVDQLVDLLLKFNEKHWCATLKDSADRMRSPWSTTQAAGIEILKSSFGGMGSINDINFLVEEEPEGGPTASKANDKFQKLTTRLWEYLQDHGD